MDRPWPRGRVVRGNLGATGSVSPGGAGGRVDRASVRMGASRSRRVAEKERSRDVREHVAARMIERTHARSEGFAMSTGLTDAPVTRTRKRTAAQAPGRKPAKNVREDGRIKSTLLLPRDLDFRLTTIAASVNLDRSQLAAQLLDQSLRRYGLDDALRKFAGNDRTRPSAEALPVSEIDRDPTD
jgi:hypothetical protein